MSYQETEAMSSFVRQVESGEWNDFCSLHFAKSLSLEELAALSEDKWGDIPFLSCVEQVILKKYLTKGEMEQAARQLSKGQYRTLPRALFHIIAQYTSDGGATYRSIIREESQRSCQAQIEALFLSWERGEYDEIPLHLTLIQKYLQYSRQRLSLYMRIYTLLKEHEKTLILCFPKTQRRILEHFRVFLQDELDSLCARKNPNMAEVRILQKAIGITVRLFAKKTT